MYYTKTNLTKPSHMGRHFIIGRWVFLVNRFWWTLRTTYFGEICFRWIIISVKSVLYLKVFAKIFYRIPVLGKTYSTLAAVNFFRLKDLNSDFNLVVIKRLYFIFGLCSRFPNVNGFAGCNADDNVDDDDSDNVDKNVNDYFWTYNTQEKDYLLMLFCNVLLM